MSNKAIRSTLESRLATWAGARSPSLRVAWENVPFTPANGETYLRAWVMPAATISHFLDGSDRDYRGIFQVSVISPIDGGSGSALGIAEEIAALFANNTTAGSAPAVQVVAPPSIATAATDAITFVVPVSITYRALT